MAQDNCCCGSTNLILACSGASNVGQITNEVAKKLDIEKQGRFFCLAGVGGHISGMVASVGGSDKILVIDGCPVACAKLTMDEAGLDDYEYVVVTDLGIEKNHDFTLDPADIDKILEICCSKLNGSQA
ncbi:putative zinc-binding protein [bacterium]|nr:putative zinc-binding protein [bacterium]